MQLVTAAKLKQALANPAGGGRYLLTEDCADLAVPHYYASPVLVVAKGHTITSLVVGKGRGNITFRTGTVTSRGGYTANGPAGYGALITEGVDVSFEGVTFENFNRGIVANRAIRLSVLFCDFLMGCDGITATGGADLDFCFNNFRAVTPFVKGWHQDPIQLRDGINGVTVVGNVSSGANQGMNEMKATGDAPLKNVMFALNRVGVTGYHSITLDKGSTGTLYRNTIIAETPGRKTVFRYDPATVTFLEGNAVALPEPVGKAV